MLLGRIGGEGVVDLLSGIEQSETLDFTKGGFIIVAAHFQRGWRGDLTTVDWN
jgi:hypothetical protein